MLTLTETGASSTIFLVQAPAVDPLFNLHEYAALSGLPVYTVSTLSKTEALVFSQIYAKKGELFRLVFCTEHWWLDVVQALCLFQLNTAAFHCKSYSPVIPLMFTSHDKLSTTRCIVSLNFVAMAIQLAWLIIYAQVNISVTGIGSSGTITGVGNYLNEKKPNAKVKKIILFLLC